MSDKTLEAAQAIVDLAKDMYTTPKTIATGGLKYDQGKPRMDLLSSIAITELAKVLEFGSRKYEAHNWRKGIAISRLLGAALRHIIAYQGGEDKDPETGLPHTAHAMCCLMFIIEMQIVHPELDDRYKGYKK